MLTGFQRNSTYETIVSPNGSNSVEVGPEITGKYKLPLFLLPPSTAKTGRNYGEGRDDGPQSCLHVRVT